MPRFWQLWKSPIFLAEAVGTGILVLGGPGTAILGNGVGTLGVSLGFGFSLLIAVYLIGNVSGAHINPAVTIGMWWAGRTNKRDLWWYLSGQAAGAAIASGVIWAVLRFGETGNRAELFTGASNGYDTHSPGHYQLGGVIVAEVVLTALLVLVVLGITKSAIPAGFAAIPIGLTLGLIHLISIPVDNTSVNPARSFATAIFAHDSAWEQIWVFVVFPVIGGIIGAIAWMLTTGEKLSMPFSMPGRPSASTARGASKRSSGGFLSGFGKQPASAMTAKKAPAKSAKKSTKKR